MNVSTISPQPLKVAVGIIKNAVGEILLSYRHKNLHQGDLWEFPGGKFKSGERTLQALTRELKEELNITVERAHPTLVIEHQYPDKNVQLHVWIVNRFSGTATSCEDQKIRWVKSEVLVDYHFPAANLAIITAARLPPYYAILGGSNNTEVEYNLNKLLTQDIRLIQLRCKSLDSNNLRALVKVILPLCQQVGAKLLLNSELQNATGIKCDGIHLSSRDLLSLTQKPTVSGWLVASCHNRMELLHAQAMGIDFVVLAPVKMTRSHPDAKPLGWSTFAQIIKGINIPVYALGGLQQDDLVRANQEGAQGIAGISTFLCD